ncbi:MAG: Bax inhibitor-1/YccA family protein, partial [Chloroflexi bacterium]|nr:Bax inhibitor-1/YccA family protein [Chloroflexota bacterium]
MNDNSYQTFGGPDIAVARQNTFIARVYGWMTLGLVITALAALYTLTQQGLMEAVLTNRLFFFGLLFGELALVLVLSAAITRLSPAVASALFMFYAALNGVTLSFIVLIYTESSVATTFFITAATFGVMSVIGHVTKRDLTSLGNLLLMGLIGFLLASVVNIFLASSAIYWVTTFLGIIIFVGLVAYDTQKIKRMSTLTAEGTDINKNSAILGALRLY